ncbi:DUF2399 domain-containing protein [Ramlibacter sp.]|uniref:DUF2399 domain-containing protein n=1 Tax=Ramlibacter sp. TaxID=1917967 RepID=UPI003D149865
MQGAGAQLRFHGDFDWPGLRIANHVPGAVLRALRIAGNAGLDLDVGPEVPGGRQWHERNRHSLRSVSGSACGLPLQGLLRRSACRNCGHEGARRIREGHRATRSWNRKASARVGADTAFLPRQGPIRTCTAASDAGIRGGFPWRTDANRSPQPPAQPHRIRAVRNPDTRC